MQKEAKEEIKKIILKYERLTSTEKKNYNEATTRKDFVMPLFSALGWDVYNSFIINEVIEEESVVEGTVDYSFRINNIPQFLLEAKSLKVDLDKTEWAKQAMSYGWNMDIEWVILTDFEALKLFNTSWKTDTPRPSLEIKYKDYLNRLDDLWLFSKESFQKGELDKQTEKWGIRSKRVDVGEKLADDLIEWRKELFQNFSAWNKDKSESEIDEAVQRILDRFIFMRSCEDRKIEPPTLWPAFQKWSANIKHPNFLNTLKPIFKEFNDKYNSNLFLPHFCEELDTEGVPFGRIINSLYGDRESGVKYNFSIIKPDVLGKVYEQYLGHLLQKAEKKGEDSGKTKRKKHGIYYTPTFIVDYIVGNALCPVLDKCKTISDLKKIKVLDPACGSGSFLVKALEIINDKYEEFGAKKSILLKHQILTENIYGVDLDEQAVEIARLNLLLAGLGREMKLPLLSDNIKNGNSLISGNDEDLKKYFGKNFREKRRFNWEEEFPEVFKQGGFDVIIGNPPYVRQEEIKEYKEIFSKIFPNVASGTADLFVYFFERSMQLLKESGYFGFITSNKFIRAGYGKNLRKYLKGKFSVIQLIDEFDKKVFEDAAVDPCIIIIKKETPSENHGILYNYKTKVSQSTLDDAGWTFADKNILKLKKKIESKGRKLKEWKGVDVFLGIKSGFSEAFIIDEKKKEKLKLERDIIKPLLRGRDIKKYSIDWQGLYLILNKIGIDIKKYPLILNHLNQFKDKLLTRTDYKKGVMEWYNLRPCDYYDKFEQPKIIYPDISDESGFYWDDKGYFFNNTAYMISGNVKKSWVGLLNSKLMSWYYKKIASGLGMKGVRYFAQFVKELPIIERTETLEPLTQKIIDLHEELQKNTENSDKWNSIKSEIEKTDKKIDEEVYKLYDLTQEEIKIIENV